MKLISVNKKEKSVVELEIEVKGAAFKKAVEEAYNEMAPNISVRGFRKGHAPRHIVEKMYGKGAFYEKAVNKTYPDAYEAAVKEAGLDAVAHGEVEIKDINDEGYIFLAQVPVRPEVKLGEYKGLSAEKDEVKIDDHEVEHELEHIQKAHARTVEVSDRAAQMGDTVVIDFEGFEGGKPFQGGKAEDYSLTLGSGSFIPGFEEALVGAVAGEERDVNVTFPENYAKELAGKPAVFKCKVHEVKESIKPELDDEFAKDVSEFDTLDALKNDIRERFTKSREEQNERAFESSAVQLAAANMTCNVPACMIDEQVDHQLEQFAYQLQSQGMKMEDYTKMIGGDLSSLRQSMRPMAEQTVRSDILLSEIARAENLEVTDEEVEKELKKLAEQYQMELDKVKAAVDTAAVKSDLMGKKAAKIITDNAVAVAPTEEKKDDADTSEKE